MLHLSEEHEGQIIKHLESLYPEEGCGFLIGRSNLKKEVLQTLPAKNIKDTSKERRYLIDPKEFLKAEKTARSLNLDVIGIYHSHPDHPSAPSEFDRAHAWPWYSYVIVAMEKGKATEMTSWVLSEDRQTFLSETLERENKNGC